MHQIDYPQKLILQKISKAGAFLQTIGLIIAEKIHTRISSVVFYVGAAFVGPFAEDFGKTISLPAFFRSKENCLPAYRPDNKYTGGWIDN